MYLHLEWGLVIVNFKLSDGEEGFENEVVVVSSMVKDLFETSKSFQTTIHTFMSGKCPSHHFLVLSIPPIIWANNHSTNTFATSVSHNLFSPANFPGALS